jgi:hypothetical protein
LPFQRASVLLDQLGEGLLASLHWSVYHFKELCSVESAQTVCFCHPSQECVLYVPFQGATALWTSIQDVLLGARSCSYFLCAIPRGSCSVRPAQQVFDTLLLHTCLLCASLHQAYDVCHSGELTVKRHRHRAFKQ